MKKYINYFNIALLAMTLCACGKTTDNLQEGTQEEIIESSISAENLNEDSSNEESSEIQSTELSLDLNDISDTETQAINTQSGIYLGNMPDKEEKILEKIKIVTEKTKKGDIVVFITNDNEYVIPELDLQIVFYRDGKIIDTDKDGHDVLVPDNTVVSKLDAPESYDNFEIKTTIEWGNDNYRNWINNLEVNSNLGDDNVIVQFKNNGDTEISELEYILVFYLGNEIVDTSYAEDVHDISSGKEIVEEVSVYKEKFDRYEIYINQAHTFDEESIIGNIIKETLPENIGHNTNNDINASEEKEETVNNNDDKLIAKIITDVKTESEAKEPISDNTKKEETVNSSSPTTGQSNALKKAQSYLRFTNFSHDGLVDQLEYEKFSHDEAVYGADNCGADWNEQAKEKAKSYLDLSGFSYKGIIEQLEYEKFTSEQAKYAADNCGADWYEQAKEKAASYISISSFSKNGLIEQLEYEGFTYDQAVYGAEQNGY